MNTRFTERFGIRYPIMQGGMQILGNPSLASAVSEAGGLGTINAATFPQETDFRSALQEMKRRTNNPFCVNFSLIPDVCQEPYIRQMQIMVEENVRIIETAGANPQELVPFFKEHRFLWIHKAPTVKHARKAQSLGADAVTIVGYEVGGHPGKDELGTNVLVRHAVKALDIPVLAAGGYADGAGLAAALSMGAEGITMGTRFVATTECTCHENFKRWIVQADESDTQLVQRSIHNMMRAANNAAAKKCLALEKQGAGLQELMPVIAGERGRTCYQNGDIDGAIFPIGEAVGLIAEVQPVAQLMESLITEAEEVIRHLQTLL